MRMEILICGVYRKSQYVVIFVSVLCIWVRFILFPTAFLIAVHTIYTLKGVTIGSSASSLYSFPSPFPYFFYPLSIPSPHLSHYQNTESFIPFLFSGPYLLSPTLAVLRDCCPLNKSRLWSSSPDSFCRVTSPS